MDVLPAELAGRRSPSGYFVLVKDCLFCLWLRTGAATPSAATASSPSLGWPPKQAFPAHASTNTEHHADLVSEFKTHPSVARSSPTFKHCNNNSPTHTNASASSNATTSTSTDKSRRSAP